MNVVFIGSTAFGHRCLQTLLKISQVEVTGIVTGLETFAISYRPDGVRNVTHMDFRPTAKREQIPLWLTVSGMADEALISWLREREPKLIIVAGWYYIVPKAITDIAPCYGLHASLLPDYSGDAPLVWAIINGEEKTGITFFMLDAGVDSGPVVGQIEVPIRFEDTIATLYQRVEDNGVRLLKAHIPQLVACNANLIDQDHNKRRVFPQRSPEDGKIDWEWSALRIYNFVRAQTMPYPGAHTHYKSEKLIIWSCSINQNSPFIKNESPHSAGHILSILDEGPARGIIVSTGKGDHAILITHVGIEQGNQTTGLEYATKRDLRLGDRFG